MMNIENPAPYPPQQIYSGYGNAMAQPPMQQPSSYPADLNQNHFQQPFPQTPQRPNQFSQPPGSQIPPHIYQQLQHQQGFARPQSRGNNGMIPGPQQRQSPPNIPGVNANPNLNHNLNQVPNPTQSQNSRTGTPHTSTSAPQMPAAMAMATQIPQNMPSAMLAQQQAQMQNAQQSMNRPPATSQQQQQQQLGVQGQNQPAANTSMSPQSASREKARVAVLLEINSLLLQEVISLQGQGKAGPVTQQPANSTQQSPTSPNAAATENANTFSPTESGAQSKTAAEPSVEYQDCMRRLQANLSYLAAIADAKKRPEGKVPPHPAIISPPQHLKEVYDLYKKLAALFPEASQSKTNQAIAFASRQQQQQQQQQQHQQNSNTSAAMSAMGHQGMGMGMGMNMMNNMTNGSEQQGQPMSQNQAFSHG